MEYILGFIILLGVLIFIHELGHFWVAKYFKMRVEAFSIGMGKKIFTRTVGETEYALSLFPIGGYVKILGQDPREEIPAELESRSFRHKPLYQRAAVVLAGPLFNAVLAIFIFVALYLNGVPTIAPVLPRILNESPAYQAGFRSGDTVLEISTPDGATHKMRQLGDIEELVSNSVGKLLAFKVQRAADENGGAIETVGYTPVLGDMRDANTGILKKTGVIEGYERSTIGPVLSIQEKSWAAERQVPMGLWISSLSYAVEGIEQVLNIESFSDFEKAWTTAALATAQSERGEIKLKGRALVSEEQSKKPNNTEEGEKTFVLAWTSTRDHMPKTPAEAGVYSYALTLDAVVEKSPAEQLGLKKGDLVRTLNDQEVQSFDSFKRRLQELASNNQEIRIGWLRAGELMQGSVKPQEVQAEDPITETKLKEFQIGARFVGVPAAPKMTELKASGIGEALALGWNKSYELSASMIGSFYHLIKGDISPKTLGGPILIGKIAGDSFREGWTPFFTMMAFISLNLFVLNLMPIPVLDGGHLVLFAVEAIRRRPVSIKVIEIWTTTGFFLLMSLIVVVVFNDVKRLGFFKFLGF